MQVWSHVRPAQTAIQPLSCFTLCNDDIVNAGYSRPRVSKSEFHSRYTEASVSYSHDAAPNHHSDGQPLPGQSKSPWVGMATDRESLSAQLRHVEDVEAARAQQRIAKLQEAARSTLQRDSTAYLPKPPLCAILCQHASLKLLLDFSPHVFSCVNLRCTCCRNRRFEYFLGAISINDCHVSERARIQASGLHSNDQSVHIASFLQHSPSMASDETFSLRSTCASAVAPVSGRPRLHPWQPLLLMLHVLRCGQAAHIPTRQTAA